MDGFAPIGSKITPKEHGCISGRFISHFHWYLTQSPWEKKESSFSLFSFHLALIF